MSSNCHCDLFSAYYVHTFFCSPFVSRIVVTLHTQLLFIIEPVFGTRFVKVLAQRYLSGRLMLDLAQEAIQSQGNFQILSTPFKGQSPASKHNKHVGTYEAGENHGRERMLVKTDEIE